MLNKSIVGSDAYYKVPGISSRNLYIAPYNKFAAGKLTITLLLLYLQITIY